MASRTCRWPGDDTPLTGVHGGTKEAALRAIAEASGEASKPKARQRPKRVQERERAVAIARSQLDQLLSKLPPITTPRKDRIRPRALRLGRDWQSRRSALLAHMERQSDRCWYCHAPMLLRPAAFEKWRRATLDHVVPLSAGGPDTDSNTVAACLGCNNAKGSLSADEFRANMRELRRKIGAP